MIKFLFLLFITLLFISAGFSQDQQSVSLEDTSFNLDPNIVVLKSILFPGTGQVSQERLWPATLYYGISLTYYLKSAAQFQSYLNTSKSKYLDRFRDNLTVAGITHFINILDAYYFAYIKNAKRWKGAMFSDKPLKSPWGATVRSAMFPGWGQWYNESYFKSAFYLATVVYLAINIYENDKNYQDTGLEKYYDDYSRFSWYMGLTYVLMLTDAHVDAYLFKFDETVDLTMSIAPFTNLPTVGLSWSF